MSFDILSLRPLTGVSPIGDLSLTPIEISSDAREYFNRVFNTVATPSFLTDRLDVYMFDPVQQQLFLVPRNQVTIEGSDILLEYLSTSSGLLRLLHDVQNGDASCMYAAKLIERMHTRLIEKKST